MNGTSLTADIVGRAVFDASGEGIGQLVNLYADAEPALFAHYDIPYLSPQTNRRRLTPCR
jgi:hypothetical protein